MLEDRTDLGIEAGDAAVVQIDDLLEIEFAARVSLATDNVERIVQACHRIARLATITRRRILLEVRGLRGERWMRGREERVEQEWLVVAREAADHGPRLRTQRCGLRHAPQ